MLEFLAKVFPFYLVRRAATAARETCDDTPPPTLAQRVLEIASGQIGRGEEGRNNAGRSVALYKGVADVRNDLGPWCASFVSWCLANALGGHPSAASYLGVSLEVWQKKRHGARWLWRQARKRGGAVPYENVQPGDWVLWDRGQEGSWQAHLGLVEHATSDTYSTIEGNRGPFPSLVSRYTYRFDEARKDRLIGFARLS